MIPLLALPRMPIGEERSGKGEGNQEMADVLENSDYLETRQDKFIFRVKKGYLYTPEDLWLCQEGTRVRLGISDLLQRLSGDMAFVKLPTVGRPLRKGEALADLETMKTTLQLDVPFEGVPVAVNDALNDQPEWINEDPYGEGWLVLMEPTGSLSRQGLLDAQEYLKLVEPKLAEEERKRQEGGGGNG